MTVLQKYRIPLFLCACSILFVVLTLIRAWEEPFLARDGYTYIEAGTRWMSMRLGEAIAPFPALQMLPPGFLFIIRGILWCGGEPTAWVIALNICIAATIPWALFLMAGEIFDDRRCACLAAFCGCVYPPLIRLSCMVLRDPLYWSFAVWAIWAGMRAAQSCKMRYWILGALFAAMAILMRREGLELVIVSLAYLGVAWWFSPNRFIVLRRHFYAATTYTMVLLMILWPINYMMAAAGSGWTVFPRTVIRFLTTF